MKKEQILAFTDKETPQNNKQLYSYFLKYKWMLKVHRPVNSDVCSFGYILRSSLAKNVSAATSYFSLFQIDGPGKLFFYREKSTQDLLISITSIFFLNIQEISRCIYISLGNLH